MNRIRLNVSLLTMLMLVVGMLIPQWGWAQTATQPSTGSGKSDDPYLITKAEELAWFRDQVNGGGGEIFAKIADEVEVLDMSSVCHPADADNNIEELSWEPIGNYDNPFKGGFDGNGKTISNLYINASKDYAGLFGYVRAAGYAIEDIVFKNAKVQNKENNYTGILAGRSGSVYTGKPTGYLGSTITNIKTLSDCSVNSNQSYVGGIIGDVVCGDISNCDNYATVQGNSFCGGICGRSVFSVNSITSCANYGAVSGDGDKVGGIIGNLEHGTVAYCANYGKIKSTDYTGGIIGYMQAGCIRNVLGCGDIDNKNDSDGGIIVGYASGTIEGIVAYNSDAKLTKNDIEVTATAFGFTYDKNVSTVGYDNSLLRSGAVTYLLQKYASEGTTWGQKLGTDNYPVVGSEDKVYPIGTVTLICNGTLDGQLTNDKPAQEGTFYEGHSANPVHHERKESTCTEEGNIEYWQCGNCSKTYSDEQMTQEVKDVVLPALGHDFDSNDVCTRCQEKLLTINCGSYKIKVDAMAGNKYSITGYQLFKFVASEDGTLEVQTKGGFKTCGTLWASLDATDPLAHDYINSGEYGNFKFSYNVTKGATYYIGVRNDRDGAIENVPLLVSLNGNSTSELPAGVTGRGTETDPLVIKTAEHLAWFSDQVNNGNSNLCAKIADNVKEIDMSTVCHPADAANNVEELSWEPIGNNMICYLFKGTFDGNGKTISNLYIKTNKQIAAAFFGYTQMSTIKNITFKNAKVENTGDERAAILAGDIIGGTITNIKTLSDCSVCSASKAGGIAGTLRKSCNISNCENYATVSGQDRSGGISGEAALYGDDTSSTQISACANYGTVSNTGSYTGGIFGYFEEGTIQSCANYGYINGGKYIGGIAGFASNCDIKNVLGCGDVNTTDQERSALIFGSTSRVTLPSGYVVLNSEAKITLTNDSGEKTEIGNYAYGSYSSLSTNNVRSYDKQKLANGYATYQLNGNTATPADGSSLVWYQKLGDNADAYPVFIARGDNVVYHASLYACDGKTHIGYFSNKPEGDHLTNHSYLMSDQVAPDGLYYSSCSVCNQIVEEVRYIKDFCGEEGKNIQLTMAADNTYKATEPISISDATAYNSPVDFTADTLNYKREYLEGNKWQAVYVPFDMEAEDWTDNGFTVANINNFHEYEAEDGTYTTTLEVKKATSGTLPASTPYIVRTNDAMEMPLTITIYDAKLRKATSDTYYCMSMTRKYDFTGIYTSQTGFNTDTSADAPVVYTLSKQGLLKKTSSTATLKPQRWYLAVSNRNNSSTAVSAMAKSISISVIGEGSTTDIKDLHVVSDGSNSNAANGDTYDLQGRKLNGEPTHGIYIKNGKKYVK